MRAQLRVCKPRRLGAACVGDSNRKSERVKIPARARKAATTAALAALLLDTSALALIRVAAAGTKPTIFLASFHDVTAFPIASSGDVAPIALTTDMASPSGIPPHASGTIYVRN